MDKCSRLSQYKPWWWAPRHLDVILQCKASFSDVILRWGTSHPLNTTLRIKIAPCSTCELWVNPPCAYLLNQIQRSQWAWLDLTKTDIRSTPIHKYVYPLSGPKTIRGGLKPDSDTCLVIFERRAADGEGARLVQVIKILTNNINMRWTAHRLYRGGDRCDAVHTTTGK